MADIEFIEISSGGALRALWGADGVANSGAGYSRTLDVIVPSADSHVGVGAYLIVKSAHHVVGEDFRQHGGRFHVIYGGSSAQPNEPVAIRNLKSHYAKWNLFPGVSTFNCDYVALGAKIVNRCFAFDTDTQSKTNVANAFAQAIFESEDLARRIVAKYNSRNFGEDDCREIARVATEQAVGVVRGQGLSGEPRIMFSEDGLLTLQWKAERRGAALIFHGDGTLSVALKEPGKYYSESEMDGLDVKAPLPSEFLEAIQGI